MTRPKGDTMSVVSFTDEERLRMPMLIGSPRSEQGDYQWQMFGDNTRAAIAVSGSSSSGSDDAHSEPHAASWDEILANSNTVRNN